MKRTFVFMLKELTLRIVPQEVNIAHEHSCERLQKIRETSQFQISWQLLFVEIKSHC